MARVNPSFRRPVFSNPIRNGAYSPQEKPMPPPSRPKLISIPVEYVGSSSSNKKKIDPLSAAMKIQKVFQGFLVRKNMKVVKKIEKEVDEIEMKFRAEEEMDLLVRDAKERLKVNEMLMRLLFCLDSVRGVRDYRKQVIRRVIALQEMVDSFADRSLESKPDDSIQEESKPDDVIEEAETLERADQNRVHSLEMSQDLKPDTLMEEEAETLESADQNRIDFMEMSEDLKPGAVIDEEIADQTQVDPMEMPQDPKPDTLIEGETETLEEIADQSSTDDQIVSTEPPQEDSKPDAAAEEKSDAEIEEAKTLKNEILEDWEVLETNEFNGENHDSTLMDEGEKGEEEVTAEVRESKAEEMKKDDMKEVMERMVAENEKLKALVVELCKSSTQQCRLMSGLAERVEHLEKVVQKMERKKRRKESGLPATVVDKKCGRDNKQDK